MRTNELVLFLQSLDQRSAASFCDFVHADLHNRRTDVRQLIRLLTDYHPDFSDAPLEKEDLARVLGWIGTSDEKRVKNSSKWYLKLSQAFTQSKSLALDFLTLQAGSPGETVNKIKVLRQLRERELFRWYVKLFKKLETVRRSSEWNTKEWYYFQMRLLEERDYWYASQDRHVKDLTLSKKQRPLDVYYFIEKLQDACELLVRSRIMDQPFDDRLLCTVLEFLKNDEQLLSEYQDLHLYYLLYLTLRDSKSSDYQQLQELLQILVEVIGDEEKKVIYNYLQNHCIARINAGDQVYLQRSFELYQTQLAQNLLSDKEGHLFEGHYKNIVTAGLRLGHLAWVKDFLYEQRDALRPEVAENAFHYNLAAYYYELEDYEEVQQLLLQVEYTDVRYNLSAKSLLLRTYYDTAEYDAMLAMSRSFQEYLKRNKLIKKERREAFSNFIKIASALAKLQSNLAYQSKAKTLQRFEHLLQKVGKTSGLINRQWLSSRIIMLGEDIGLEDDRLQQMNFTY